MSQLKGLHTKDDLPLYRPDTSILKLLEEALCKNGNSTALIEELTGKSVTFAELLQLSRSLAAGLRKEGVNVGDYVVLCCNKSILAFALYLGTMFSGATATLYSTFKADIMDELTKSHHVKAVFYDSACKDSVTKSVSRMRLQPRLVAAVDEQDPVMASLIQCTDEFLVFEPSDVLEHVPLVLFTSGTTGEPKPVPLFDLAIQLGGLQFEIQVKTFLLPTPMFWYVASVAVFVSSILRNYTLVITNGTEIKKYLQLVERYQVEGWLVNSGTLGKFVIEPSLHTFDLSSVKRAFVGGDIVLRCVHELFNSKVLGGRAQLEIVYGSTECGFIAEYRGEIPYTVGACSRLYPGVELKIVDDEGKPVGPGTVGQLRFKSPSLFKGYLGSPEINISLFDAEGFFTVGDSGMYDTDGRLFVKGRTSDIITYKQYKISPSDIEDILIAHPDITEAAVVGKLDPENNQLVTAYVVKRPTSTVTEEDIASFISEKVDDTKKPRGGVYFIDALPRVIIGKVLRKELREYPSK